MRGFKAFHVQLPQQEPNARGFQEIVQRLGCDYGIGNLQGGRRVGCRPYRSRLVQLACDGRTRDAGLFERDNFLAVGDYGFDQGDLVLDAIEERVELEYLRRRPIAFNSNDDVSRFGRKDRGHPRVFANVMHQPRSSAIR